MITKDYFSRFYESDPNRLHFAAHSHHPWPDVSFEAHSRYWADSARYADDKWDHVFGEVVPDTKAKVASILGLTAPDTLTFAPNTHSFLLRLFSCFETPVRILTTGSEFHSFARQSRRWEESGLALIDRIDTEPFSTFQDRIETEIAAGAHDLIYISSVFFDSGYPVEDLEHLVAAVPNESTFFVIDGYHQFMARPIDLSHIEDRVFFIAGGYKYAMSGEGVCFMHCPAGYGPRPVDTGWYAGFGQLEGGVTDIVPYNSDGSRFAGATFDPSGIYRLGSVLEWLDGIGFTPKKIHEYVVELQEAFLESDPQLGELLPEPGAERGNFLTFRSESAGKIYNQLHEAGVVTDYRGDRLRFGFGIYQDRTDVDRLTKVIATL